MAAGLRPSRTNAARPRSRGSPLHTHKRTRLLQPETKPREAHEPREPARALRHGPLRELEECAAPRLPLRGPCHRLPVCRRRWRGRTRGRRSVCGGARGVGAGAERAGPEDRDVLAGVLRRVHGRWYRRLRAHAHDRHAARPRQVQHADRSGQGACKFGFYEFFKKYYSDIAGPEYATKYKTLIYLAGSASAELIADIALCPMEAVKVCVQTQPGFARGLSDGLPKFVKSEGYAGLYKGIVPLWARQIPYTMMKFASFETVVEMIYKYAIPAPKSECSKNLQLGVSFAGGYIAGVFCAIVSHPADNLVSFLNNAQGATVGDAVKKIGLVGLFTRGLPLRIVMIGTLTGAQWGIYDAFKVMVGLSTTGGVAPTPAAGKA